MEGVEREGGREGGKERKNKEDDEKREKDGCIFGFSRPFPVVALFFGAILVGAPALPSPYCLSIFLIQYENPILLQNHFHFIAYKVISLALSLMFPSSSASSSRPDIISSLFLSH